VSHGFFGDLPFSCPCGTAVIQSCLQILTKCPLYEEHHLLIHASQDLSSAILSTHKGLMALGKFINASNAFGKT
ncbi:hypothetical protein BU17DRAFT_35878, partial [Hysterangium stoloniferum]